MCYRWLLLSAIREAFSEPTKLDKPVRLSPLSGMDMPGEFGNQSHPLVGRQSLGGLLRNVVRTSLHVPAFTIPRFTRARLVAGARGVLKSRAVFNSRHRA